MAGICLLPGEVSPFSQFKTVAAVTSRGNATSICRLFKISRRLRICSPKVLGSKSVSFGIRHLRDIRQNDKKATRLCPCGYHGDPEQECRCTPDQIQRYRYRVSGPLLDRIDLYVTVNRPRAGDLLASSPAPVESSATVRARVLAARELQMARQGCVNAALPHDGLARLCRLPESERAYLEQAVQRQTLSARGLHRVMRVARTLADLERVEGVTRGHLEEALAFRDVGAI